MIKFGTDGWRGKIADDFTMDNVRLVTQAIVNHIRNLDLQAKGLVVGYDNRFFSERYAKEAAKVIARAGIKVYLTSGSVPSPVVSFAVKNKEAAGAIMITASHNPPEWNGLKFKTQEASSAPPEVTKAIEQEITSLTDASTSLSIILSLSKDESSYQPAPISDSGVKGLIDIFDPKPEYFKHLSSLVDLGFISKSNIKPIIDPMHGSGLGYLSQILKKLGMEVVEINNTRDPLFGGINPEPLAPNLEELTSLIKDMSLRAASKTPPSENIFVGIALDGDGDRIGAVDATGKFINPHQILALLLQHLVEYRKLEGEVVKTFNITSLIDKLAGKYNLKIHQTPIGFKYISELMLKQNILIGGEESGGIGIKGHIPERDSTLCGLLLLEMMAARNKTLGQMLDELSKEFGHYFYNRADLHISDEKKKQVMQNLKKDPPTKFAATQVIKTEDLDGLKFFLEDGSWILFRPSGTEPLLRIYVEAPSEKKLEAILTQGEKIVK